MFSSGSFEEKGNNFDMKACSRMILPTRIIGNIKYTIFLESSNHKLS